MPRLALPLALALILALAAPCALAETHATAPAGGGLPALTVRVDLAAGVVLAGEQRVPVGLDRARLPAEASVAVEVIAVGSGRHLVRVRVPARDDDGVAWEALLAGGQPQPLFAGMTGFTGGDPGERTGKAVRVVAEADRSFVLVGDVREDLGICGQPATLLEPEAVYPASLDLRPATVQRLDEAQRANARPLVAVDRGPAADAPLARLLVARGSSVQGSRGAELTDGDPATAWSEDRPGMGQGEFVTMAAPTDVPVARLQIVLTPRREAQDEGDAKPPVAAPRTFYLVTAAETFLVTMPGDAWRKPGEAYEIVLPEPIRTSCVSLVLGEAYARDLPHPRVTVAELTAYSEFDVPGATLVDVARQLSGPRGAAAAQVLERAGASALAAVKSRYGSLDARGRALAIDVACSHDRCEESAPLLARGLCEASGQAPRKAREKLERCKEAIPVLAAKLRDDPSSRACVAPALVALAGQGALEPIADAIAATALADVATRAALRAAFAQALQGAAPGRLAPLLADAQRSPRARLEMMRAAGPRVAEARGESERALEELFAATPPMRDRYLALGPLGELARAGDAGAGARITGALAHDADWPVRARAAEVAPGLPSVKDALLAAARDAEPRVREAALQAMTAPPDAPVLQVATATLGRDGWSFVRVSAIGVLARAASSSDVDAALAGALEDGSARVRGAAVVALGRRRAASRSEAVRRRLDDGSEDVDVRSAAARALGAMCDGASVGRLTELARKLAVTGASEDEQQVALGALEGLAAIHPPDLESRLAPLRAKTAPPSVHDAADRALAARGVCR